MHLLDPLGEDYARLCTIFETIYKKNAIALLGAGASVTNKKYLSKDLIELYEMNIAKKFGTDDIIKFVDILQATPGLSRSNFDRFVIDQLTKLSPNEGHNIFVTIPWKQVITTNFDTLIEEASELALKKKNTHYKLHIIRNKKQFTQIQSDAEISYIKLHGCKTDLSLYPLVFSSDDFAKQVQLYKKVTAGYGQFSNEIIFISFGFSYSDKFADVVLEKLANVDVRQKKTLYCIDPFVNEDRLSYLTTKHISVVKIGFEDFFVEYKKWFENSHKSYLKTLQKFTNPEGTPIQLDISSRLCLDNNILQLKDDYNPRQRLKKSDFYFGEEPNYQVVLENYDVIRSKEQKEVLEEIDRSFTENSTTIIPRLILIHGDFGSGKTTFTLRIIREYLKTSKDTLAFEITNPSNLRKGYVSRMIDESNATRFIFYCDNIETDSIFKAFTELRVELASEQRGDIKIVFVSSIRENILKKYLNHSKLNIPNLKEFDFNPIYSHDEVIQLVDNLKDVGLINYRDTTEKDAIVYDIKHNYKGDSFITLYKLIDKGFHYKFLERAYTELSPEVKTAFKLTALIHRFNIPCPVTVIKNALKNFDWTEFTDKVVKGDGKGILYQETKSSVRNIPDLYFKTKHPIIAEALIDKFIKNNEKNALYKSIFQSLSYSVYNAGFIVDLIKGIKAGDNDITAGQIDNYFEVAKIEFSRSPHFMLAYITNIEKNTRSIPTLQHCLDEITQLEATLDNRNHRLIHRKGNICFKIAKTISFTAPKDPQIREYIYDAEEWFDIKKHLDPLSAYSYMDYFTLLIWKLKHLKLNDDEKLGTHQSLNTLFDEAYKTLPGNTHLIDEILNEYYDIAGIKEKNSEYEEFLLDRYQDVHTRPSAAILLYYYYERFNNTEKCEQLFSELQRYADIKEVVYFLFKYYGRNLHVANNRIKFFNLLSKNDFLKEESVLRYHYFNAICEFYNLRWNDGKDSLNELNYEKSYHVNPDFFQYWKNEDDKEEIFEGTITKDKKIKKVKITDPFFKQFYLTRGSYDQYVPGNKVLVKLKFFLDGVKAEIVT